MKRGKEAGQKENEGCECWEEMGAEGERGRWREKEVAVEKRRTEKRARQGDAGVREKKKVLVELDDQWWQPAGGRQTVARTAEKTEKTKKLG